MSHSFCLVSAPTHPGSTQHPSAWWQFLPSSLATEREKGSWYCTVLGHCIDWFTSAAAMGNNWEDTNWISKYLCSTQFSQYSLYSSKRRNQNGRHFAPDQKFIRLIKHKHRLWTRYLETRDGQKYTEYCRVRNQVRSQTRKLAKIREQEIAREAKNNPKKFWQFINQRLKTKSGIPDLRWSTNINGRGNFAVTDVEKAEVLSDFFSVSKQKIRPLLLTSIGSL